ncbi:MAG: 4-alpha-glucanotransferase, partial [Pseudomonas sp.]
VDEPPARLWGLAAQLYSLRREGGGGYGDCMALEQLARSAAERGADAIAISPIHALSLADQQHFSPYSPSSRLQLNSLYASPATVLGERAVRLAVESCLLQPTLDALEQEPLVNWPVAADAQQRVLEALYKDFNQGNHPLREDFDSFCAAAGEPLTLHCRFELLQAEAVAQGLSGDWRNWPPAWQDPHHPEVEALAAAHPSRVEYHAFCQWLTERSLQRAQQAAVAGGMAIGLIADLAVGADGAGSQAWSRQDELLASLTVGAPPDILNRSGQDWGISAFSPEGLKRNGYRAFIEMLRANLAHAGGLRIDHVMGLRRLWLIPNGAKPSEGAYLNFPLDDLLRLLALESVKHEAVILGEDLGTVPDGLRETLASKALLGMRVLPFEQHSTGHFKAAL